MVVTGALVIKTIMIAAKLVPILSSISLEINALKAVPLVNSRIFKEINALIAVHQDKKRILTILNASKLKRAKC
jgi:hypothetical protein